MNLNFTTCIQEIFDFVVTSLSGHLYFQSFHDPELVFDGFLHSFVSEIHCTRLCHYFEHHPMLKALLCFILDAHYRIMVEHTGQGSYWIRCHELCSVIDASRNTILELREHLVLPV